MKRFLFAFSLLGLIFLSCNEETPEPPTTVSPPTTTSTQENTQIQSNFDDVNRLIQLAFERAKIGETSGEDTVTSSCYEVYVDFTNKTAEIVFDETIICLDGKRRKGKFNITYTGPYRTAGTIITTTLENYEVNAVKLEGTKTVTNNGLNMEGNLEYTIEVTNAKRTGIDGKITTWNSSRTREWIAGSSTALDVTDDIYLVYGTSNGNNSNSQNFTVNTSKSDALKLDIACWLTTGIPVSGKVTITPEGEEPRTVDYGDGSCDRNLTLDFLGNTFNLVSGVN